MTPVFCCGAECGIDTSAVPSSLATAGHWLLSGAAFTTTNPAFGARALRANPSATTQNAQHSSSLSTAPGVVVSRTNVRIDTVPTANRVVLGALRAGTNVSLGLAYNTTDGKWYAGLDDGTTVTLGASGVSITTGIYNTIDIKSVVNVTTYTVDVQVNGVALGQASLGGQTASNTQTFCCGVRPGTTATFDITYDDIILSITSGDYPIGAGKVLAFVPASDGSHTATGTHIVQGTIATPVGAAITSATTDSFNWVNGRPILGGATDNTRLINQQTAASTEYAEHGIEQTTEVNAPRTIEVLCALRHAAGQACNSTFKINDNGTENTVFADTGNSNTTDCYARKHYATMPADSANWTLARFNALKLRYGYSSDATPDVYNRGWMVEAEFPITLMTTNLRNQFITKLRPKPFAPGSRR